MAYRPRIEVPFGYYHVVTRGNNKRRIFDDDSDRELFVMQLSAAARRHGWTILAYCLMGNHYHVVLQLGAEENGLSRGMCELNSGYALEYNERHGRVNHLFGKRYWSALLTTDRRVMAACRYAILNPVRAQMVETPDAWTWSSYRATIGLALAISRLAVDDLLVLFGRERDRAIAAWEAFVADAVSGPVRGQPP